MGAGPPWMSKSAYLFLQLLRDPQTLVRRCAAEGLGLLFLVGLNENIHPLQSSIMISLDEMLAPSTNDIAMQQKGFEGIMPLKAGYLHTLACIQRSTYQSRGGSKKLVTPIPTLLMLTRLLPYTSIHIVDEDSFMTRTSAIRAFNIILSNSNLTDSSSINPDECHQILSKTIEVIENNFFGAWKSNSIEIDIRQLEVRNL